MLMSELSGEMVSPPEDRDPLTVIVGRPEELVLLDASWVWDDGIHLVLERYELAEKDEFDCRSEVEVTAAFVSLGASEANARAAARSLWLANEKQLDAEA